ncbi:unnamed protein product [Psylliodes chrysocephalus]|uniref:CRAL-TRIO domain-containing protein n=1 Tax=Psylliodes chrysocephalus TaxID=3402493 RepID=A0A9P0G8N5_9CUCU|nr:unnamed protein product [Psylliodes chrysocephala]
MMELSLIIDRKNKVKILERFDKTEKDLEEDVELIQDWFKSQPHLPEIPSTNMIEFFLVNSKFSKEITKQKLDMYYTVRSIFPDFYQGLNPKTTRNKNNFDYNYFLVLPKLVDELYRVTLIKLKDIPFQDVDVESLVAKAFQVIEIRIQEDLMFSDIVIIDCENLKMSFAMKFTPMIAKIIITILEKVYSNRIREINIINYHSSFDYILKLAKVFMKPKMFDRIRFHKNLDSLKKNISLDVLPKDYGGDGLSIDEIQVMWKQKYVEYQNRFDKLDTLKVDETLRPVPMKDLEIFGMEGTFKKLNID